MAMQEEATLTKQNAGKEKMTRKEKSWVLYDWANSAYATIMMAAVFPIFFSSVAKSAGQSGDYWWGLGTAAAMLIVAVLAPITGALADFMGYKKKLFIFFLVTGLAFTLFSAFAEQWPLMLLGYIVSHIGFSGSCLVYDSFLPDTTTPEKMDRLSGYGFAFGYIGGSTIPFLISIALITFGGNFGIDMALSVKLSVVLTAVWWGIFSIPFIKNAEQIHGIEKPSAHLVGETFASIGKTMKNIYKNKNIFYFVLAYFFYIDGVGTIIKMSTSYGATLGISSSGMILALLLTQIIAFPCSIGFSALSKKFGSMRMLTLAVCVYLLICVLGFIMGFGLEEGFLDVDGALKLFWALALLVGTVQGGIQAISRSYYSKLIPPDNAGEYFGFFDIFGKFASVLGPALYAASRTITGRSSFSILSIILLFAAALAVMGIGKRYSKG